MRLSHGQRYRLPNGKVVTAQRDDQRKVWVLAPERGRAVWIVTPGGKLLSLTQGVNRINPNQIRVPGWVREDLVPLEITRSAGASSSPFGWLRRLLGLEPKVVAPPAPVQATVRHIPRPRRPYRGPDVLERVMLIVDEDDDDEEDMRDKLKYMLDDAE